MPPDDLKRRNRRTGIAAFGFVAFMVGVSFAAVPLYDLFCRMTGYNGTPMIFAGGAPGGRDGTAVTVRFNATVHAGLPWDFAPDQRETVLQLGEEGMGFYTARNLANVPVEGVSTYNVTPEVVGRYFHKVACFCFEAQTLAPGQEAQMPLVFWVDPKIAEDPNTRGIRTITVSYTFYRSLGDAERAGALANAGPHVGRRDSVTR